jgi:hypothetical protein
VDGWIGPPNGPVAEAFALMAEPGPEQTAVRLVGVCCAVVPDLAHAYLDHVGRARAISDGPSIRWLRLVLRDELADRRRAMRLLRAHETTGAEGHRRRIAGLLAEGGGISGDADDAGPVHHPSGDEQTGTTLLPTTRNHA